MAPFGDSKEVLLIPSMGRVVAEGLDQLKAQMTARCHGRDEAIAAVRSLLRAAGIEDPDVRLGGLFTVPANPDLERLLRERLAQGCYVYDSAQFDERGRYTWFIARPR